MKLYSYVLAHDAGSAPNPFWGHCTLAICKPKIRLGAGRGDWVVGIGPAGRPSHGKLIYAMQIEEILPLGDYFSDPRFQTKKPDLSHSDWRRRRGDNQYRLLEDGSWSQLPGPHGPGDKEKDVRGRNCLISSKFYYFGSKAKDIPERFNAIVAKGRGHRCKFPEPLIEQFIAWIESTFSVGIHGEPSNGVVSGSPKSCDQIGDGKTHGQVQSTTPTNQYDC